MQSTRRKLFDQILVPFMAGILTVVVGAIGFYVFQDLTRSTTFEIEHYSWNDGTCFVSDPLDVAVDTRTSADEWERSPELDQITYNGDLNIEVYPQKDQYAYVPDENGYWPESDFTMYPDVIVGTNITIRCVPSAPLEWSDEPSTSCPVTIEQIAEFTHTHSSQWDSFVHDDRYSPKEGITFHSSEQLSNYPLTGVKIDEVPQGVFVSRRAAASLNYPGAVDSSNSPLTPGYQNFEGLIGYIEVYCGSGGSIQSSI